jgi:hypothetical protein
MNTDQSSALEGFRALGDEIEALWSRLDYAEDPFPALATQALQRHQLPDQVRLAQVLRATLTAPRLTTQRDPASRFGEPALTVYNGARFYIDVYAWFSGTTALHQHAFAGAFQVLDGSSIHGHYTFEVTREVNPHFRLGRLALHHCELLEVGAVRPIAAGSAYIHRLFHLDQPSATVVVRTVGSPQHQPQFSYHPPGVAVDHYFEDGTTTKKMQCLAALQRSHDPQAEAAACSWLANADLQSVFQILESVRRQLAHDGAGRAFGVRDRGRFERLLDAARPRHGVAIDLFAAVFGEQERLDLLVGQRAGVTDRDLRFFLALLLNVEQRDALLSLVQLRFPGENPREKVLAWVGALARTRIFGAPTPNALGIAGFDDYDLLVLELLLEGLPDDAIAAALVQPEAADVAGQLAQLHSRLATLRAAPVLLPLLRPSG